MRAAIIVSVISFSISCAGERAGGPGPPAAIGDPAAGKELIQKYACTACHQIPGIGGRHGSLGPSLARAGSQPTLGGRVPNQPETMARFLVSPQSIDPQNTMPPVGLSGAEARHITAYLMTLR